MRLVIILTTWCKNVLLYLILYLRYTVITVTTQRPDDGQEVTDVTMAEAFTQCTPKVTTATRKRNSLVVMKTIQSFRMHKPIDDRIV